MGKDSNSSADACRFEASATMANDIIQQQIEYYRARAREYDDWFYRQGRYDRGLELNDRWFAEVAVIQRALHQLGPFDQILELACGTGLWTQELLQVGRRITAIDASPEMIAINQQRLRAPNVQYQQNDLFGWEPDREYDLVFLGFWLSHVPPERLDSFLDKVRRSVQVAGQIFVVDSLFEGTSTANNHVLVEKGKNWQIRRLNDGREFQVVKVFYDPEELAGKLARLGFEVSAQRSGNYFLYVAGTKTSPAVAQLN